MKRFALLFLVAFAGNASAETKTLDDAAGCSAISDSLQRLTCFDRVFPKNTNVEGIAPSATPNAGGNWDVSRERSAIDDSPSVYASLLPLESSNSGPLDKGIILVARCVENTTSVMLHTGMFMTDSPRVTIRIGTEPATTTTWARSTNYEVAGLWRGDQAIPFLRSLKNGQKLAIRVESRQRADAVFDLGNVEDVNKEIAEACNWPV